MHRQLTAFTISVLMITGMAAGGARAEDFPERELEEIARGVEGLFGELLAASHLRHVRDVRINFKDHGNGVRSFSIPLEDLEGFEGLRSPTKAKALRPLATGHQLSEPEDLAVLIHAVLASLDLDYNHWWAWINTGNTEIRETTVTHKGPGPDAKFKQDVEYAGGNLGASWFLSQVTHQEVGEYFQKVKIEKGGSKKAECFAQ